VTAPADPVGALMAFLAADAGVAALVDAAHVYGGGIEQDDTPGMPFAAVVVNPSGGYGGGEGFNEFGRNRIDTICHGSTLSESWQVYLAVHAALKHLSREVVDGVLLHSAEPLSKGALGTDPETQWPTTLASWRVLSAEIAA
jgi:hypothetical protein